MPADASIVAGSSPTNWQALVLPVFTLASAILAAFSRYMRSSMMDALTQDYIRTARAKGASGKRVLFRHALRNALIPIVTLARARRSRASSSGAVITETVFNYPGMGLLTYNAALSGTTCHRCSARPSWRRSRRSSARSWPTSCTPSSTRGSAMPASDLLRHCQAPSGDPAPIGRWHR